MTPMPQWSRREQLERLIMGLMQSIEHTKGMLPYYEAGDLEGVYAKKFLKAAEEHLEKSKKELEDLDREEAEKEDDARSK